MLVTPPQAPSRATGEIEALLVELGFPPLDDLDDERTTLAENHDDLFEEIAAFARRGWAYWFDAETGLAFDLESYEQVLAEILQPVFATIEFDGKEIVVGQQRFAVRAPTQDDDWLDVGWIFETVGRLLADTGWRLVTAGEDLHEVIAGVVPDAVWTEIAARGLAGAWGSLSSDTVEPDYDCN
jgi:hypothetical protein